MRTASPPRRRVVHLVRNQGNALSPQARELWLCIDCQATSALARWAIPLLGAGRCQVHGEIHAWGPPAEGPAAVTDALHHDANGCVVDLAMPAPVPSLSWT